MFDWLGKVRSGNVVVFGLNMSGKSDTLIRRFRALISSSAASVACGSLPKSNIVNPEGFGEGMNVNGVRKFFARSEFIGAGLFAQGKTYPYDGVWSGGAVRLGLVWSADRTAESDEFESELAWAGAMADGCD